MSTNSKDLDLREKLVLQGYTSQFDPHDLDDNMQARNTIAKVSFLLIEQSKHIEWKDEDISPELIAYNLERIYNFFDWMA